tara:strand:+ start:1806 stop:2078 length:273 start_codon:yes stop_codon:yes gene_type:complete
MVDRIEFDFDVPDPHAASWLASMLSGIMRGMASALDEHAEELGMVLHDIIPEDETYDNHPLDGLRSAFYDAAEDLRKHEKAIREAGQECV